MATVNLGRVVGRSAYEESVRLGYKGSEEQWLETLRGKDAYILAQEKGYQGTEDEWLESLKGKSAYLAAVDGGYSGSEEDFNVYIANLGNLNTILDYINGEVV